VISELDAPVLDAVLRPTWEVVPLYVFPVPA